jgi:ribosomal protein S18 acetylase RimI-like enzyme
MMKIRFLKVGEDKKWYNCIDESGDSFTHLPNFCPELYVVTEENQKFIGCMKIIRVESQNFILFNPISKINPALVLRKMIAYGLSAAKTSKVSEIMILIHDNNPNIVTLRNLIPELGFELKLEKALYRLSPDCLNEKLKITSDLKFHSLKKVGETTFLDIFRKIYRPDRDFDKDDPNECFQELKARAINMGTYRPNNWLIAYFNKKPIGVILPQLHDAKGETGSNFYLGVVPKMRGRGFGHDLQYFAVQKLIEEGVRSIVGSTDIQNVNMLRIFESLGYNLETIQYFYYYSPKQ